MALGGGVKLDEGCKKKDLLAHRQSRRDCEGQNCTGSVGVAALNEREFELTSLMIPTVLFQSHHHAYSSSCYEGCEGQQNDVMCVVYNCFQV